VRDDDLVEISTTALERYQVVSEVDARVLGGMGLRAAILEVVSLPHRGRRGELVKLTERTVYRWWRSFDANGIAGLEPKQRQAVADSAVLSDRLVRFLRQEKIVDKDASVPELIRRARQRGVIGDSEAISRITVWRACRHMGLPVTRAQRRIDKDMRRYAFPNRMLCVLADGKHFRAGAGRAKRVALILLDDATRLGLGVSVGPSECTDVFLQALHESILRWGLAKVLYLDRGPGFISDDTTTVLARLGVRLIWGTKGYPEGHGKIERFNRTMKGQVLRGIDGSPGVGPDPAALTLRLSHWLDNVYNRSPHEGIGGQTPEQRWAADSRDLEYPESRKWLAARFLITFTRMVSNDNVIPFEGTAFEVPKGHRQERITVTRHLLEGNRLSVVHKGRRVTLHPVDLEANAYARRARGSRGNETDAQGPVGTAAGDAFEEDFEPMVTAQGDYPSDEEDS
jgi:putative transposase